MIEVYLVRHGETNYNKNNLYIGGKSSHLPINEVGISQSKYLGKWFSDKEIKFDFGFCSTATRAKQTLNYILEKASINAIEYAPDLEELSQGDWEGQLREKIYTPEQLKIINTNNYQFKAPNGESQEEVEQRIKNVYLSKKENIKYSSRTNFDCITWNCYQMLTKKNS